MCLDNGQKSIMRCVLTLLAMVVITVFTDAYALQPLSRERKAEVLASWKAGINILIDIPSDTLIRADQVASLIRSARERFREIPSDHQLYVSGMAAADTVEAIALFTQLNDQGFKDQQKREKFNAVLQSALDPIFYLYSYSPSEWRTLRNELPEIEEGAIFHDLALEILSSYSSMLVGKAYKENALNAAFDQAYFRVVSGTGQSPDDAIARAKKIATDYGIDLAPFTHSWARTVFAYADQGRCDDALRLAKDARGGARQALIKSPDREIAKGLVWLLEIEAQCVGESALSMSDSGSYQSAQELLQKGLASLNESLESIGREHLGGANTSRLVELRSAFLAELGGVISRDGNFGQGIDYIRRAALSSLDDAVIAAAASDTEYSRLNIVEKWNNNLWQKMLVSAAFVSNDSGVRQMSWQTALLSKNLLAELARLERRTFHASESPETFDAYRRMRNLLSTSVLCIQDGYGGKYYDQLLPSKRYYDKTFRAGLKEIQPEDFFVREKDIQAVLRPDDVLLDYVIFWTLDQGKMALSGPPHYGVYVVNAKNGLHTALDLGPAHIIDAAVNSYRAAYDVDMKKQDPDESGFALLAKKVRQLVLDPVIAEVGMPRRFYIAPVSRLSLMPFESLPTSTKTPVQYLIESTDIIMLSAARDLVLLHPSKQWCEPANNTCTATLVGDPKYELREASAAQPKSGGIDASERKSRIWKHFNPLSQTRKLVNRVSRDLDNLHIKVTPLLGSQASETSLYTSGQPQILLIASHGHYVPSENKFSLSLHYEQTGSGQSTTTTSVGKSTTEQPREDLFGDYLFEQFDKSMQSIIALAGASDKPQIREGHGLILRTDDGQLTAFEAELLNLDKTDLVMLVGCETGMGFVPSRSGEVTLGYPSTDTTLGFRRSLQIGGARTIVGSLWEVLDYQATQYARDFVRLWLADGKTRYRAHHMALLNRLKEARQEHNSGHPVWWAGFVYQGDPGDLP